MKILKILFVFVLLIFSFSSVLAVNCKYSDWQDVSSFLNNCKPSALVWKTWNFSIDWTWSNFKSTINWWIKNITLILSILAVLAYVVTWMQLQFSGWQDEAITKAKNSVIWISVWFIAMISVSGLIYIVVNVMYSLW